MTTTMRLNVDVKSTGPAALTIGEVAEHFGLATHVLRHWESMGLLAPARAEAGRRRYRRADLYRIAVILSAKQAGFALDDIRDMVTASDPARRKLILRRQRDELTQRIAQAHASLALIDGALACDHDDIANCPRFRFLLTEHVNAQAVLPGMHH
ncbi:MerR family transcriptional regulator [Micromonospora arborensis]|uniref:helix-turn-helix domain-containing protein n=1 Tax=Micromonospora arborensis TaxID=2116518 RepID=UPI0033E524E8